MSNIYVEGKFKPAVQGDTLIDSEDLNNDADYVESISAGTNVTIDNTDPKNPIISSSGGGGGTDNYVDSASFTANQITLGRTGTLTDLTATMPIATTSANGALSSTDKSTIDSLSTVATSGSYNDLSNRPTIPTARTDEEIYDLTGSMFTSNSSKGITSEHVDASNKVMLTVDGYQDIVGLNLSSSTDVTQRASTITGNINIGKDNVIIADKIANGATGTTLTFAGGEHTSTVFRCRDMSFNTTTPVSFGTNPEGNIKIEIDKSNLDNDPLKDVLGDIHVEGYIVLSDGNVIYYGAMPYHQEHFDLIQTNNATGTFNEPYVKIDTGSSDINFTLPDPDDAFADQTSFRYLVKNAGDVSSYITSGDNEDFDTDNVVLVNVPNDSSNNTRYFKNGLEKIPVRYNDTVVFMLERYGANRSVWNVESPIHYTCSVNGDGTAETGSGTSAMRALVIQDNNDEGYLWSIPTTNNQRRLYVSVKCRLEFKSMKARCAWTASDNTGEFFSGIIRIRKNGTSTNLITFRASDHVRLNNLKIIGFVSDDRYIDLEAGDYIEFFAELATNVEMNYLRAIIDTEI